MLEMLRLLQLPWSDAELHEIVRYSVRRAPRHYLEEPCPLEWFQLTLNDVQYWDALRTSAAFRHLRLVVENEAAE
jgi:hypothetical protein